MIDLNDPAAVKAASQHNRKIELAHEDDVEHPEPPAEPDLVTRLNDMDDEEIVRQLEAGEWDDSAEPDGGRSRKDDLER